MRNTAIYSDLACFVNTLSFNMYGFLSYIMLTRRNTVFIFVSVRHRNVSIRIPHVAARLDLHLRADPNDRRNHWITSCIPAHT